MYLPTATADDAKRYVKALLEAYYLPRVTVREDLWQTARKLRALGRTEAEEVVRAAYREMIKPSKEGGK